MSGELAVDVQLALTAFRLDARFRAPMAGITALFGPSGAGKSLLLDLLAGVRRADAANVTLADKVLDNTAAGIRLAAHERGVGLVFQDARLFPHLDVRGNLAFAASRASRVRATPMTESIALHFGITHLLSRQVRKLSGGEKARVALARALLSEPNYLLLDEPFAALDGTRRAAFISTLRGMHQAFAIPMLVVTHQIDDAVALAEYIVGMEGGRVVGEGPIQQALLATSMRALLAPRDVGAALSSATLKSATADRNAQAQWVRADHVLLAVAQPTGLSARNIWRGTVQALEREEDGSIIVSVMTDAGVVFARITAVAAVELKLSPGQAVWAIVKAHSL